MRQRAVTQDQIDLHRSRVRQASLAEANDKLLAENIGLRAQLRLMTQDPAGDIDYGACRATVDHERCLGRLVACGSRVVCLECRAVYAPSIPVLVRVDD